MPTPIPPPTAFTVTDALGREVTFAQAPQRIVITGRGVILVTDAVYLFPEASTRVVALAKATQNVLNFIKVLDPQYDNKTLLESPTSIEEVAAARPDVVLLKSSNAETLGKPLGSLGIPVVYLDFETPEQYRRDLLTLGSLFQNEARAQQLIRLFQERTDRVTGALADLKDDQKPRVLLVYYTDQGGAVAFNIPPLSWIQSLEVQLAGGDVAWKVAQLGNGWTKVTLEQIAAWDADQIYVIAYTTNVDDVVARLKADPQWQPLRAVKAGKLYGFAGDLYSWDQPDPRWILGLTWLAAKIHPERFGSLDMQQEIRDFYRDFYSLDEAAVEQHIQPNLKGDLS